MSHNNSRSRFHIGMRNIKTGISVFICLLFYHLIAWEGTLLACISAIICMQDSVEKSLVSGRNRLIGTTFGALFGMLFLYLNALVPQINLTWYEAAVGTMLFILFCNVFGNTEAIVIGCITLLTIILSPSGQSPFFRSAASLTDMFIGITIAVFVNHFVQNPFKRKHKND